MHEVFLQLGFSLKASYSLSNSGGFLRRPPAGIPQPRLYLQIPPLCSNVRSPYVKPPSRRPKCNIPTTPEAPGLCRGLSPGGGPGTQYHTKSLLNPYVCHQWSKAHSKVARMGQDPPKVEPKTDIEPPSGKTSQQVYTKR